LDHIEKWIKRFEGFRPDISSSSALLVEIRSTP
jgi:hypothetical protein